MSLIALPPAICVLFPSDGGHPCSAAATPHSSAAHLRPPQSFSARSARPSTRITSGRLNLSRRGAPGPVLGLHGGWRQEVKLTVVISFRNAATAAAWTSAADGVRLRGGVGATSRPVEGDSARDGSGNVGCYARFWMARSKSDGKKKQSTWPNERPDPGSGFVF